MLQFETDLRSENISKFHMDCISRHEAKKNKKTHEMLITQNTQITISGTFIFNNLQIVLDVFSPISSKYDTLRPLIIIILIKLILVDMESMSQEKIINAKIK